MAVRRLTAGIVPFPDDPDTFHSLFESDRWITFHDATGRDPFPKRITTTFTFLRYVDMVGVFLVGEEKGEMFRELLAGEDRAAMPGRIILSLPRVAIYTDESLLHAAGMR